MVNKLNRIDSWWAQGAAEEEAEMAEQKFHDEYMVGAALQDAILERNDDIIAIFAENGVVVADVVSFGECGVLTRNAGFVLTLTDGAKYQVTVVRSR